MPQIFPTELVTFPNNRAATTTKTPQSASGEEIVRALSIRAGYNAMLQIIGGADNLDESVKLRLIQLFGRGIARAAVNANAVIIDGGTASGVMQMMGQGVNDRGFKSTLIGVAPLGLVTYPGSTGAGTTPLDPNHSHFVLVDGDFWGCESNTIFKIVSELRRNVPGVAVIAGGGQISGIEVLHAVRNNLAVIVIEGSGGFADMIATAWNKRGVEQPEDPLMAEIIADGRIEFHRLSQSIKGAERLIASELGGDNVLLQAWENFAEYDLNAMLQQRKFARMQKTILLVGVVGTFLTVVSQVFSPKAAALTWRDRWWWLNHSIIAVPIILTVLITATNRFKQGNKWLFLRAGAESIKREIYRYRTRTTEYREVDTPSDYVGVPPPAPPSPEQQLARKLQDITQTVMDTEVSSSGLLPYNNEAGFPPYVKFTGDDGFSQLTPDRYIDVRLADQLSYYKKKTLILSRALVFFQWAIFIVGGIGTYLAVVNQQVWIALTTSIVAALTSHLGYSRAEESLTKYNQAKTELGSIRWWWLALEAEDQEKQQNIDILVEHTEQVLKSELDNWVQLKQKSLAELRRAQAHSGEKAPERRSRGDGTISQAASNDRSSIDTIVENSPISPWESDAADDAGGTANDAGGATGDNASAKAPDNDSGVDNPDEELPEDPNK